MDPFVKSSETWLEFGTEALQPRSEMNPDETGQFVVSLSGATFSSTCMTCSNWNN
jgi:hypothetical protein